MYLSRNHKILYFLVLWRVTSVFVVQTAHVPDEYWQSLEVAHRLAFGYGYLTWEWTSRIRSFAYPYLINLLYQLLAAVSLDHVDILTKLPRLFQAILAGYGDYRFYTWTRNKWMLLSLCINWYWYYCATRTLVNSLETTFTVIALSIFPWKDSDVKHIRYFWIVGFLCTARPTAVIIWTPLCTYHLCTSVGNKLYLALKYASIAAFCLAVSVSLDTFCYGTFVVSSWQFFRVNVLEKIGDSYGKEHFFWYIFVGLPVLLGVYYAIFFVSIWQTAKNPKQFHRQFVLTVVICWTIFVYSLLAHKEFRFILPLLPMAIYVSVSCVSRVNFRCTEYLRRVFVALLLVSNIVPGLYFSLIHQRGSIDVMGILRNELKTSNSSSLNILFLTPCHATPLYSHLHTNTSIKFLTCEPNLQNLQDYRDEADEFFAQPSLWLDNNYNHKTKSILPSHVVIFNNAVPNVTKFLTDYRLIAKVFHTHFPQNNYGEHFHVYKRKTVRDVIR